MTSIFYQKNRAKGASTHTTKWGKGNTQIGLSITSGSLYKCRRRRPVGGRNNLISDIEGQNVIILGERIDGSDVQVEKVCRPSSRVTIDGAIYRQSQIHAVNCVSADTSTGARVAPT